MISCTVVKPKVYLHYYIYIYSLVNFFGGQALVGFLSAISLVGVLISDIVDTTI